MKQEIKKITCQFRLAIVETPTGNTESSKLVIICSSAPTARLTKTNQMFILENSVILLLLDNTEQFLSLKNV